MSFLYHKRNYSNLRLDTLHAQGDITVTNSDALNSSYNTIADVFDSDNTTNSMIVLDNNEDSAHTLITINNNQPQFASRITISVGVVLTGRVIINESLPSELTLNWDTGRTSYNTNDISLTLNFPREIHNVSSIKILYDTFDGDETAGNNDVRLYGVQLFGNVGESKLFEFNDSVLTTKAWNSSRYDGRQLSGFGVNEFKTGDTSFGNTPVVRNSCRTFYVASALISLHETDQAERHSPIYKGELGLAENDTLHTLPGFSYILVDKAITVDDDLNIHVSDINTFPVKPNTTNFKLRGFQTEFQNNFKILDRINVKSLDNSKDNKLKPFHNVYFNGGRLQEVFRYRYIGDDHNGNTARLLFNQSKILPFTQNPGNSSATRPQISPVNPDLFQSIFTGSFSTFAKTTDGAQFRFDILQNLDKSIREGNRYFFTFGSGSRSIKETGAKTLQGFVDGPDRFSPLIIKGTDTVYSGSIAFGASVESAFPTQASLKTGDLHELSTFELKEGYDAYTATTTGIPIKGSPSRPGLVAGPDDSLNTHNGYRPVLQSYIPQRGTLAGPAGPSAILSGSMGISKLNEEIPALLVDLDKPNELSSGRSVPILVLPAELHPFVKDNLIYFTALAGLDIGTITRVPALDETNRNLS